MKMMHRRAISLVTVFGVIISCAFSRPLIKSVSAAENSNDETSNEEAIDEELPGLDIVQTYNLICFGDYVNHNSDVKGPSAIGGKITASEITFGNVNEMPKSNNYGLVAGKTDPNNISITQGHSNTKAFVNDKVKAKFTDDSNKLFDSVDTWSTSDSFKQKVKFDFGTLQTNLKNTSETIASLTSNCDKPAAASSGNNVLIFTGKDPDCNIFSVDAETLRNHEFVRIDAPDGATNVINVTGSSVTLPMVYNKDGGTLSPDQREHLLWNLSEAVTFSNQKTDSIEGSVLAPNAEFLPIGSSNYEGTLIVNSFDTSKLVSTSGQQLGFQGHFYPFMGKFPSKCFNIKLWVHKTAELESQKDRIGWDDRTYKLTLDAKVTNFPYFAVGVTVTDVIDSNFELTEESKRELKREAKVKYNTNDGTTTVVWKNQIIKPKKTLEKTLHVQAKTSFIGGNNIPTNADGSGVSYLDNWHNKFEKFPQPTVNVKTNLTVGSASETIFRGETVPIEPANSCKTWNDSRVNFQWCKADEKTPLPGVGENVNFPDNLTPDTTTTYVLQASFDCGEPTLDSTNNSGGKVAGTPPEGGKYICAAKGTYTVTVVSGELVLTKNMDAQYPAPDLVKPQQSFVFQITRTDSNCPPETFYEVIAPKQSGKIFTGSKTITGLKKGVYTITEETGGTAAAWRYGDELEITNTDIFSGKIGKQVNIGRDISTSSTSVYLGSGKNNASVTFTNHLSNFQWFGDTTVAVNTIHN